MMLAVWGFGAGAVFCLAVALGEPHPWPVLVLGAAYYATFLDVVYFEMAP